MSLRSAFPQLVGVIGRIVSLRAAAVVPRDPRDRAIVWSSVRHERALVEAEVIATATLAYFDGDAKAHRDDPLACGALGRLRWVSLPIMNERGDVLGVLAVAAEGEHFDEASVATIASLAPRLAPLLEGASRPAAPAKTLGELTSLLFDTLDYRASFARVARLITAGFAKGCVIDVPGDPPLRIAEGISAEAAGVASTARIPLRTRDRVLGSLYLLDGDPDRLCDGDVEVLARQMAVAVHNGRLYEDALTGIRAREDVLSVVSHDLKNPLGTILMSAAQMLDEPSDGGDRRRTHVERIQRSARRMRRLVGDLLDVAALESGALSMAPTTCSAEALVREAIDDAAATATSAGITLVDEVTGKVNAEVWVDPERIQQVFRNLIGNALKFTRRGGRVTVRATADDRAGLLAFHVEDTGIGMNPAELTHAFERFWRAEPARAPGSGLGLAICKSLVERGHGTIRAASTPGTGTTLTFTVPLAR